MPGEPAPCGGDPEVEAALQPRSEQPEPPASPAPLPSFTGKLQPQCPPPKGPPHLPLPEKGQPVLGSLTRGTLLCLELHSAAQRTERWLAEGGPAPTIPAPGVVLAWLPWHGQWQDTGLLLVKLKVLVCSVTVLCWYKHCPYMWECEESEMEMCRYSPKIWAHLCLRQGWNSGLLAPCPRICRLSNKLHSRILHLSSGDLLAEVERSRSLTQTRSDVAMHECQLSAKSGAPALKGPGVGVVLPGHLCLRSRCSSSELSLSSTCSEYSSGSSCTWHDGKNLRKRPSSQNWDKRLSIDSSLPSGFASPTDELPRRESHILEGLRKLQKRQVLLEPPSVITKWGYKDCMNSNEGIYSPGIKSSPKEHPPCKTADTGVPAGSPTRHLFPRDPDEGSSSFAWTQALPGQACRLHGCRLTHSVSDSLFSWELNGRHLPEGPSVYPGERPERLSSCASSCPSERKQVPGDRETGVPAARAALQLSDTDDKDTLDELHIESSDEKSPSDLSLATDTDKSTENLDALSSARASRGGGNGRPPTRSAADPGLPAAAAGVRRPSSEEGVAVIFDAEDGEPIELSAPQTGVSPSPGRTSPPPRPRAPRRAARAAQRREPPASGPELREAAPSPWPRGPRGRPPAAPRGGRGDSPGPPGSGHRAPQPQDGPAKPPETEPGQTPAEHVPEELQVPGGPGHLPEAKSDQNPSQGQALRSETQTPGARGRQEGPLLGPRTPEKSPAQAPGKRPGGRRAEGPAPPCDLQPDSHWAKRGSQTSRRREGAQGPPASRGRPSVGPGARESPSRGTSTAQGPPPLPRHPLRAGRSPCSSGPAPAARPEAGGPHEAARAAFGPPLLKGQTEVLGGTPSVAFQKPLLAHPLTPPDMGVQTRCPAYTPCGSLVVMAPGPPKGSPKRGVPNTPPHQTLGAPHADTGFRIPRAVPQPMSRWKSQPRQSEEKDQRMQRLRSAQAFLPGGERVESPPSPGHSPSASSRSHSAPHGGAHPAEKGGKPRLAAGLRALLKSPQPLRKSSTVPGKQEKDSLNEASKSSVAASKARPATPGSPLGLEAAGGAGQGPPLGFRAPDRLAGGLPLGAAATPETLEHGAPGPLDTTGWKAGL
ncbi:LOW QUALITY PROTEIN: hypothetical protein QTO34_003042 [Cnephaeus nilssonii]|uniref:Uncharacterized protein n=1 Tax=Cnephaeus nilssonii TaxID=3371016 RepID=A0AA40HTD9_CNENI|nr:LOW QUALITY PROTEIN: hypothetical protein QTO34_003042 [Eptesicus nilssonii]